MRSRPPRRRTRPPAVGEARKQRGRRMRAGAPTGRRIRRRAREQHRGLAAPVGAGNHGHRVVERHPQVANPPQALQPDLVEEVVLHLLLRPQGVPDLSQRRVKDGHRRVSPVRRLARILSSCGTLGRRDERHARRRDGIGGDPATREDHLRERQSAVLAEPDLAEELRRRVRHRVSPARTSPARTGCARR